jgi:uncharacterized membrane protein HdeD (DUF308 family)
MARHFNLSEKLSARRNARDVWPLFLLGLVAALLLLLIGAAQGPAMLMLTAALAVPFALLSVAALVYRAFLGLRYGV